MKVAALFVAALALVAGARAGLVEEVNAANAGWTAAHNQFSDMSVDELKQFTGTLMDRELNLPMAPMVTGFSAPDSFNARDQWSQCAKPVRNQGQCGSCWAVSAAETASFRLCVGSGGQDTTQLSPEDLVECDSSNYACQGGYLNLAWQFIQNTGLRSEQCNPYVSGDGHVPSCPAQCVDSSASDKRYYSKNINQLPNNVATIQAEIMKNGPVQVAFNVYQDFMSYKSGVYKHTSGGLLGGHAVMFVGWGEENGTPYWLVQNSWDTTWGEQGFFKIVRGVNECGIESQAIAGIADLSRVPDFGAAPAVTKELIDAVNSQETTWTAGFSPRFEGASIADAQKLLGTMLQRPVQAPARPAITVDGGAPDSFDSRTQWPHCIGPIRDQGQCGSCWATSLAEVLSDRFCIASSGAQSPNLGQQWLVSCDKTDMACQGGYLENAWEYTDTNGIGTEKCFPYVSGSGSVPPCPGQSCSAGSGTYQAFKSRNSGAVTGGEEAIKNEIYTNGPVQVGFSVYQDFMSYSSGVYQHKTGGFLGGHAVKIIGWGTENGTPYWLVANSWNTSWGQDGFFKILRGSDECGIESGVVVGEAAL